MFVKDNCMNFWDIVFVDLSFYLNLLQSMFSFRKDPTIPNSSSDVFGFPGRFDSSTLMRDLIFNQSRFSSHLFFQ